MSPDYAPILGTQKRNLHRDDEDEMMKIKVLIINVSSKIVAIERLILLFSEYFSCEKFELHVACPNLPGELNSELLKYKVKIHNIPFSSTFDLVSIRMLRRIILKNNIDIVHSHQERTLLHAYLATRFLKKRPYVLQTEHNRSIDGWEEYVSKNMFVFIGSILLGNRIDKYIAVSKAVKNFLVQKQKIKNENVAVIPNAVNTSIFKKIYEDENRIINRSKFGIKEEEIIIGTVARLELQKGHTYLLQAAKLCIEENRNIKFLLVGDGSLRQKLICESKDLGILENVIFMGWRTDIPELMRCMDIFLLPSLWEGMPLVVLEAMSTGIPVIATKVSGTPEIIHHNKNGLLIEPKNIGDMYEKLKYLIKNSDERHRLSMNAQIYINESFTAEIMTGKIESIYSELYEKRKRKYE